MNKRQFYLKKLNEYLISSRAGEVYATVDQLTYDLSEDIINRFKNHTFNSLTFNDIKPLFGTMSDNELAGRFLSTYYKFKPNNNGFYTLVRDYLYENKSYEIFGKIKADREKDIKALNEEYSIKIMEAPSKEIGNVFNEYLTNYESIINHYQTILNEKIAAIHTEIENNYNKIIKEIGLK